MNKILVTGGSGFIGSHLVEELEKDRRNSVAVNTVDILSKSFQNIIKNGKFDYIYHLAGNADQQGSIDDPKKDMEVNFLGTFDILETLRVMRKKSKLIFASSVTVYGESKPMHLTETDPTFPFSPYGASKLAAERYISVYAQQYGIPAISLRLFSTYGPRNKRQVVYDFIRKLTENPNTLEILGDGQEGRDMTYVKDQVANIIKMGHGPKYEGEVYNLGSGRLYTTEQIAHAVAQAMNLKPKLKFTGQIRSGDANYWLADISKIENLGCITTTPLVEGIKETVSWYND